MEWDIGLEIDPITEAAPSSGFDWGHFTSNVGDWLNTTAKNIGPWANVGKAGFEGWLGWNTQQANAAHARAVADYNRSVQDYLNRRSEWEGKFLGAFEESQGGFREALGGFQEQMSAAMDNANAVFAEQMDAARPLITQSQELLEPAIAALARGEVPEQWQPLLDEAKQRARAAAMQTLASAGMDESTASAAITPQIDQAAHQMFLQLASSLSQSGLAVGQQGLTALSGAAGTTGLQGNLALGLLDPVMKEFQIMNQVMASLFGDFPKLGGAPVA